MQFKIETGTISKHINAKDEKSAIREFTKNYPHESCGTLKTIGKRTAPKNWYLYGKNIEFVK